jgi:hypothetical protein
MGNQGESRYEPSWGSFPSESWWASSGWMVCWWVAASLWLGRWSWGPWQAFGTLISHAQWQRGAGRAFTYTLVGSNQEPFGFLGEVPGSQTRTISLSHHPWDESSRLNKKAIIKVTNLLRRERVLANWWFSLEQLIDPLRHSVAEWMNEWMKMARACCLELCPWLARHSLGSSSHGEFSMFCL